MHAARLMPFALALALFPVPAGSGEPAHPLSRVHATDVAERLDAFSSHFMGREYADDSGLGEGPRGEFDRNPLVRFDKFHCVSFLETVVALAVSSTVPEFEKTLQQVRYRGSKHTFEERNHFPCLDWIPNNIRLGIFEDITAEVGGEHPLSTATALVDRRGWYSFMTIDRIERPDLPLPKRLALLDVLKARGKRYKPVKAQLRYLPFSVLFPGGHAKPPAEAYTPENDTAEARAAIAPADDAVFRRIPSGSIVNIVRPNWNVLKVIGTRMNVSHQGFLFWKNGQLLIRHAKREPAHRVVEEEFIDYLRRAMVHRTVDGIHLLRVRAKR